MKLKMRYEHSAFGARHSTQGGNAGCHPATTEIKKVVAAKPVALHRTRYSVLVTRYFRGLLIIAMAFCLLGAGDDSGARFNSLGHKMICACGCNQILLECNHVGCPLSDGMRNELSAAITRGSDSDNLILQAFVQKYGPTVLAAPTTTGFNRIAWIMPFFVLFAGFASAVLIVRSWKGRSLESAGFGKDQNLTKFQEQIRQETDL